VDEQTMNARAVIADAEALLGAGLDHEAVAALRHANRRARHADIEQRLVSLRHAVGARPRPVAPTPPDRVTSSTEHPSPLTPISPADLDVERLRAGLAEHGCVWVRGLIPPDRAAALAGGIDAALAAFDADDPSDGWYAHFTPNGDEYRVGGRRNWVRRSGAVWTADSPRMLHELTELVDETGVLDLVTSYLGEVPALSANKCTLRRVPTDTNTGWHQDGAFLGEDVRTLNLWLALGPCGVDAPGLDVVPRRLDRVVETGGDGTYFDWDVSPDTVERVADGVAVVRPEFEAGDALLFDHLFLHRTAVAPGMSLERHAMETWFFAPSAYPKGQIPLAL